MVHRVLAAGTQAAGLQHLIGELPVAQNLRHKGEARAFRGRERKLWTQREANRFQYAYSMETVLE